MLEISLPILALSMFLIPHLNSTNGKHIWKRTEG